VATTDSTAPDDWLQVGVVAGAMGVHGEVKVDLTTDFPDRFQRLETVYVGPEHQVLHLRRARRHHGRVVLTFDEVQDRDAAASLQGAPLYVPRDGAMPLPPDHYYHDQVLGLHVQTTDGRNLGTVVEILVTGSNDVYVTQGEAGEILIPALKEVVRRIDLEAGLMLIEPMEGLF
jgi:16S rRNA processing protein RimM